VCSETVTISGLLTVKQILFGRKDKQIGHPFNVLLARGSEH
jgi:hypothetical protein